MASWKKVLVSGSNISELNNDAGYIASLGGGIVSSSAQIDHDQTTNFDANEHFTQANITTVGTVTAGSVTAILPAGTVSSSAQIQAGSITGDIALGTQTSGNYVATLGSGTGVSIGSNTGEGSTPTIAVDYGSTANTAVQGNTSLSFAGTTDEITIDGGSSITLGTGGTVTIGLADTIAGDRTFSNNVTVGGNLTVDGDLTYLNTANLLVEDPFILLASGSAGTGDSGIIFGGSEGVAQSGNALFWDASYNSNDGRLSIAAGVAQNATSPLTPAYSIAGVFEGTEANAATAQADHPGNIRIESGDIFIYV